MVGFGQTVPLRGGEMEALCGKDAAESRTLSGFGWEAAFKNVRDGGGAARLQVAAEEDDGDRFIYEQVLAELRL